MFHFAPFRNEVWVSVMNISYFACLWIHFCQPWNVGDQTLHASQSEWLMLPLWAFWCSIITLPFFRYQHCTCRFGHIKQYFHVVSTSFRPLSPSEDGLLWGVALPGHTGLGPLHQKHNSTLTTCWMSIVHMDGILTETFPEDTLKRCWWVTEGSVLKNETWGAKITSM